MDNLDILFMRVRIARYAMRSFTRKSGLVQLMVVLFRKVNNFTAGK